ncbi:MAG: lipopolysaccharide biosynthesis protein [Alistipes sp.]|nr:lipopolysaccharide biosynthesis protein [Alistipes sp.]
MSKISQGLIWSGIERISYQGVQLILTLIIARLVNPSDYGIVAMLTVFLSLAQVIVDSGFANALIQKINRTEADFSTVFWFNLFIGIFLYIVIWISSPSIAGFYSMPQLDMAMKIIAINLIINAVSIIQKTKLIITLNFRRQAYISFISIIISGSLGVFLALKGYGYWALVIQTLTNNLINSLLLWIMGKWIPSMVFSLISLKKLFSFGSNLMIASLLDVFYNNIYSLVIGKKYNSTELGFYNRAYMFGSFPFTNISTIISRVMYPSWCKLNSDDKLVTAFIRTIRLLAFIVLPISLAMGVLSEQIIRLTLTEKWLPMRPYFIIISLAFVAYPLTAINDTLLKVKGRTELFLKTEVIKKIIGITLLIISLPFGIFAICLGLGMYFLSSLFVNMAYSRKILGIKIRTQLKALLPIIFIGAVALLFYILPHIFLRKPKMINWFKLGAGFKNFFLH